MSESNVSNQDAKRVDAGTKPGKDEPKPAWQPPKLEDVSEQVMAQPYIRFT
jgi:hypothetical protein